MKNTPKRIGNSIGFLCFTPRISSLLKADSFMVIRIIFDSVMR